VLVFAGAAPIVAAGRAVRANPLSRIADNPLSIRKQGVTAILANHGALVVLKDRQESPRPRCQHACVQAVNFNSINALG
jgi:hypothetical protein